MLDALFVYIYGILVIEIADEDEEDYIPWEIY
jgi:hypothetical protein